MKSDSKKSLTKGKSNYLWKDHDKTRAVVAYSVSGSFSKAAAATGIPEMTIRYWAKQDWWTEEMHRADQGETDELKAVYTRIAKRAAEELEDRLDNGDQHINKEGEVVTKKVAARDLAIITGVAADQRRKQMDAPKIVAVQSSDEKLAHLLREFIKFAKAKDAPPVLEAEIIEENVENVREDQEISEKPV